MKYIAEWKWSHPALAQANVIKETEHFFSVTNDSDTALIGTMYLRDANRMKAKKGIAICATLPEALAWLASRAQEEIAEHYKVIDIHHAEIQKLLVIKDDLEGRFTHE